MPLEIASTPVNAAQPEENARRIRNQVMPCVPNSTADAGGSACRSWPIASRTKPTTMSAANTKMNPYVGIAKIVPDSRIPRKFSRVMMPTAITPMATLLSLSSGNAETTANTPAAIDTATVMM